MIIMEVVYQNKQASKAAFCLKLLISIYDLSNSSTGLLVVTDNSIGIIILYSSVDPVSRRSHWRE